MSNKVKRGFVLSDEGEYMLLQLKAWRRDQNYSELVEEALRLLYEKEAAERGFPADAFEQSKLIKSN
jgi:hypothetical protein